MFSFTAWKSMLFYISLQTLAICLFHTKHIFSSGYKPVIIHSRITDGHSCDYEDTMMDSMKEVIVHVY